VTSSKRTKPKKLKPLYTRQPWQVRHQPETSEIEACNEETGQWEIIADIHGARHVPLAECIIAVVNAYALTSEQFEEAIHALELCLESAGLSWEAEQASEIVVKKARKEN